MSFNFKDHPGTAPLILFTIMGALAGAGRLDDPNASRLWPLWGALIVFIPLFSVYLYGGWNRKI